MCGPCGYLVNGLMGVPLTCCNTFPAPLWLYLGCAPFIIYLASVLRGVLVSLPVVWDPHVYLVNGLIGVPYICSIKLYIYLLGMWTLYYLPGECYWSVIVSLPVVWGPCIYLVNGLIGFPFLDLS